MADLGALRDEFAAAFEAGEEPDPSALLARVSEKERQELEDLIDRYLMTAPRRAWDAEAYETSLAKLAVERAFEARDGVSGDWPELLPRERDRRRLKRTELVRRLAEAIGVGTGDAEVEKVGFYYNRMEHGALRADGVSATVLDALGSLLGTTAETLRRAGAGGQAPAGGAHAAYARIVSQDVAFDAELADAPEAASPAPAAAGAPPERDRIDELFTGG